MFFSALYTTEEGAKGSQKGLMGPKLSAGAGRASERPKLLVVYIVHYIHFKDLSMILLVIQVLV